MNINELQTDIEDHKNRFGDNYGEISQLMLPLFMFHQKLLNGICNVQEGKYKLSNSEVDTLITTYVSGSDEYIITPTKLHQKLLFTTGAITKVLKKLEDKELIIRIDDEYDKRSKLVKLTPQAVELVKNVFKDITSYQESVFNALTKKEKESFTKLVLKLLKEM